jgi:FkbM family methyltransferase
MINELRNVRELPVKIGDEYYNMISDDDYLDYVSNDFEPEMVALFKILAVNSKNLLDIGANIGCTALLFSKLAENVWAFEPSPSTFSLLEENINRSGLSNIHPQNIGLGAQQCESTITFAPSNRSGGFISDQTQASKGHATETVVIDKLDEFVCSQGVKDIDFIKIDVEGFEGQVIRGGEASILKNKPLVVLELNHWCLNAFQRTSIPDFFDHLRSVFPILLAVDGMNYLDIHDESDNYNIMYHHIIHMRFPNIIAAFNEEQLGEFRTKYDHGFKA